MTAPKQVSACRSAAWGSKHRCMPCATQPHAYAHVCALAEGRVGSPSRWGHPWVPAPDRTAGIVRRGNVSQSAALSPSSSQYTLPTESSQRSRALPPELEEQKAARAALMAANPGLSERRKALAQSAFVRCAGASGTTNTRIWGDVGCLGRVVTN